MKTKKNGYGLAVLTAAAFGLLSNLQAQTISAWTNAVNGNWSDAGAWSAAGVPNANMAHLTNYLASYAVTYDSVNPAFKDLRIENTGTQITDLLISAPLVSNGGAALRFRRGSRVTVNAGGIWTFDGATNSVTDKVESMMSIRDGGEFNLAGGIMSFTNLPITSTTYGNYINVGYQSSGTLNITSGRLDYYETVPRASTNNNRTLRIGYGSGGNGTLEISGGAVLLGKEVGYIDNEPLQVGVGSGTRGLVVISGGRLSFTNPCTLIVGHNFGIGTFIVTNTGTAYFKNTGNNRTYIGRTPSGNGMLRMDGGYFISNDGTTIGYSAGYSTAVSATGVLEVTSGTLEAGASLSVGMGQQGTTPVYGFVNVSGGRLTESYYGVYIGRSRLGGVGIGSMTITNGLLDIIGGGDPADDASWAHCGIAVGSIYHNDANASNQARGELLVAGSGIITNISSFIIGANGATGTLTQTGGVIRHAPPNANRLTNIGYGSGATSYFGGGNGTYALSGGSFYTPNRVFVGGVPVNVQTFSRSGGTGLLKVTGGSFTVTNNTLMVGGYGTGTVTIGSNGVCFAKDIVFTNNTQSTLRCELGTEGLGTLTASSNLAICAGAKLEVDTRAYQGKGVWVKLADCATRTGSFDPANITITGQGEVKQDRNNDQDVWLYFRRGTMIAIL